MQVANVTIDQTLKVINLTTSPAVVGIEGKSAFQVWKQENPDGSYDDWILSLKGPKGEDGEPGAIGPAGSYSAGQNITIDGDILNVSPNPTFVNLTASSIIRNGGLNSQFLKADGSVDSNPYLLRSETDQLYQSLTMKNIAGGYVGLDGNAKIPTSLFPDEMLGNVRFRGLYNGTVVTSAYSTYNALPLPNATANNAGVYFIASQPFLYNLKQFNTGDWIISVGSAGWDIVDNSDSVTTVFGRLGNIVPNVGDYSVDQITGAAPLANPTFTGIVTAPNFSGSLTGNSTTASQLQNARSIWGQNFNGSADVTGAMSNVSSVTGSSASNGQISFGTTGVVINRNVSGTNPALIVNSIQGTGNIQTWQQANSPVANMNSVGKLFLAGMAYLASSNNASIDMLVSGTNISRNILDANPVLNVNSIQGTGNIQQWQQAGATVTSINSAGDISTIGRGFFGSASATTAQLRVIGGASGTPLVTLVRTSGISSQYSWALAGGGLSFSDDTNGFVTTNIFGTSNTNSLYLGQALSQTAGSNSRNSLLAGGTTASVLGPDLPSGNLTIQANLGTGAGTPGDMIFSTGNVLASGSGQQSAATRVTIKSVTGNVLVATGDLEFLNSSKGPVLIDRGNATKRRLIVTNRVVSTEAA